MRLIVGLGNPGEKFQYSRHNLGFMVVEKLVKEKLPFFPSLKAWKKEEKFFSLVCRIGETLIVKPQTYMNASGLAVLKVASFYQISPPDIWVVYDDLDLPLGKLRIRKGGASAGHHGVESLIRELKTSEFVRFRLGIGRGKTDKFRSADTNLHRREVEKYVLSAFSEKEGGEVKKLIKKGVEALKIAWEEGLEAAINRFN